MIHQASTDDLVHFTKVDSFFVRLRIPILSNGTAGGGLPVDGVSGNIVSYRFGGVRKLFATEEFEEDTAWSICEYLANLLPCK